MVKPPILLNVLGIPPALFLSDAIIVFNELKVGNFPALFVEVCRPSKDGFWKGMDIKLFLLHEKRDEESVLIYNHCAATAEAFNDGNIVPTHTLEVEVLFRFARDSHHDCPWGTLVDNAKVSIVTS